MRSRVEVLREYLESQEKRDEAPERMHRWAVDLECGCTTEALTRGDEHLPTEGRSARTLGDRANGNSVGKTFVIDNRESRSYFVFDPDSHEFLWPGPYGSFRPNAIHAEIRGMPPGFLWCAHDEHHPYREIKTWAVRKERWSSRSGKRYAGWNVILSCGHSGVAISDLAWRPEHGHAPQPDKAEALRAWLAKPGGSDAGRRHMEAELLDGCPAADAGGLCRLCLRAAHRLVRAHRAAHMAR